MDEQIKNILKDGNKRKMGEWVNGKMGKWQKDNMFV